VSSVQIPYQWWGLCRVTEVLQGFSGKGIAALR
jgi:hypothetical protein